MSQNIDIKVWQEAKPVVVVQVKTKSTQNNPQKQNKKETK